MGKEDEPQTGKKDHIIRIWRTDLICRTIKEPVKEDKNDICDKKRLTIDKRHNNKSGTRLAGRGGGKVFLNVTGRNTAPPREGKEKRDSRSVTSGGHSRWLNSR